MLVYIMGRPHSGSTILDIGLNNSAAIESVGELVSGIRNETQGAVCACGATILDCPYWQKVREAFPAVGGKAWAEARDRSVVQAHVRNLWRTLTAPRGAADLRFLGQASAEIAAAIKIVSGKPHMLDSSKEPTRGLMLLRFCPDARVIHLVRDPRRSVASHYWRFKKMGGYFHFLRRKYYMPRMLLPFMMAAAASWTAGNLICELGRWMAPGRVLRVRYEDLCDQPAAEFTRIAAHLGVCLDDLLAKLEQRAPLTIGHNLGGNQIRHDKQVVFNPEKGRAHELPGWLEALTFLFCWPLMLAYGYRGRASSGPS